MPYIGVIQGVGPWGLEDLGTWSGLQTAGTLFRVWKVWGFGFRRFRVEDLGCRRFGVWGLGDPRLRVKEVKEVWGLGFRVVEASRTTASRTSSRLLEGFLAFRA